MIRPTALFTSPFLMLALAACEPVPTADGAKPQGLITVPEAVSAIAATHQDLSTARVRPQDGCYWYTHVGPVETTELPLRTKNGSPICTRPSS